MRACSRNACSRERINLQFSFSGINTPIFYLAHQAEEEGLGERAVLLQAYLGLAWALGCAAFGLLVVRDSVECRIARQYLCQAAVFMCGLSILALTAVHGNYHGYVLFAWIYGIFAGGYHYSLKMYTYERVRARNFARTWGFVQCSQAIPIALGVPISGYMNVGCGANAGYYFSSTCALLGSLTLFFVDLHRRRLSRHKHTRANGTRHLCVSEACPQRRRLSFTQEPEDAAAAAAAHGLAAAAAVELSCPQAERDLMLDERPDKPELTCISEEGIADMDLPDNLLDDLDYIGDCITSCNKVRTPRIEISTSKMMCDLIRSRTTSCSASSRTTSSPRCPSSSTARVVGGRSRALDSRPRRPPSMMSPCRRTWTPPPPPRAAPNGGQRPPSRAASSPSSTKPASDRPTRS